MTDSTTKICTKCDQPFPATTEYFSPSKLGKYGLRSKCKPCEAANGVRLRASKGAKTMPKRRENGLRQCSCCENWFPETADNFSRRLGRPGSYYSRCRECSRQRGRDEYARAKLTDPTFLIKRREYKKARYHQIPEVRERALAQHRETEKRPEVREKRRISDRERLKRNPSARQKKRDFLRELRKLPEWRDYYREYNKQYSKSEHGRAVLAANKAKRRAVELEAEGEYSVEDVKLQLRSQKYFCWWCGKQLRGLWHIDHRVALTRGGTNWPNNLCISCPHCNLSKGNKLPHEWTGRLL